MMDVFEGILNIMFFYKIKIKYLVKLLNGLSKYRDVTSFVEF